MRRPPHRRSLRRVARLASALAVTVAACDRLAPSSPTDSAHASRDSTVQIALGVRHRIVSGGVQRALLRADTARFPEAMTHLSLRGVRMTFYATTGDSVGTLTARSAEYDLRRGRLALAGDVTARSFDGRELKTPRATYDVSTQRLTGDSTYALTASGRRTTGIGFDADPALRDLRAPRAVRR
jgi:LPS export ABC transporter protein LptC